MSVIGLPLWNFEDIATRVMSHGGNTSEVFLGLLRLTHSKLVCLICEDLPLDLQRHLRSFKFVTNCKNKH